MKKYFYPIIIALTLMSSHADAFLDIFVAYGKRHMTIRKTFVEALSTENKKWKQVGVTCPDEEQMFFAFVPENQPPEKWEERFTYYELGPKFEKDDLQSCYEDYFSEKLVSRHCYENIIFQNDSEIKFESYYLAPVALSTGARHMLTRIIKVNDPQKKFIAYIYQMKNRNLSPEEKEYWFQMFDYARIDF